MMRRYVFPAAYCVLVLLPLSAGLIMAMVWSVGGLDLSGAGWTGRYWSRVVMDTDVWISLAWSAWVAGMAVVVSLALAAVVVLRPLSGVETRVVAMMMALPAVVTAFLVYVTGARWLVQDRWGMGMLLAHLVVVAPFLVLLVHRAAVQVGLPRLLDVARSFGAKGWRLHAQVSIPVLWSRVRFQIILVWIAWTGSFEIPLLVGRSWPEMISVLVYRTFARFSLETRPEAFVMALVYVAVVTIVFVLAWRHRGQRAPL
jgi:putative spermidine/putrescine transport system permease protein